MAVTYTLGMIKCFGRENSWGYQSQIDPDHNQSNHMAYSVTHVRITHNREIIKRSCIKLQLIQAVKRYTGLIMVFRASKRGRESL